MKKQEKKVEKKAEKKPEKKPLMDSLKEWVAALNLGKSQAVMAAVTLVVLVVAFLIFNNTSV